MEMIFHRKQLKKIEIFIIKNNQQIKLMNQVKETISLLTSALNIHLNIGQNLTMNTSSIFMSLETISIESLSNKFIQPIGNAQIHIPSNFNSNIIIINQFHFEFVFFFDFLINFYLLFSSQ